MAHEWRYIGEPGADQVPPWLLVGPGPQGTLHAVAVCLARMRQGLDHDGSGGFVQFEILLHLDDDENETAVRDAAIELEAAGMAERRDGEDGEEWRASTDLVTQVDEAFARRPANP